LTTTSYANGATVSGNNLILAPADGTNGGVVTTGAQTFAGNKTFSGTISTTSLTATGGLTAGAVTYPIAHGSSGQVLSTTGSGTLTWTTAAGGISGNGTQNYLPKYGSGGTTLGNSLIFDNGTSVGINTSSPGGTFKLDVNGAVNFSGALTTGTVTYPNAHGAAGQVLYTTGNGTLAFTTITPGSGGGITGVGAINANSVVNGAYISGSSLILAPADPTYGGIVTTGAQAFAGTKTFNSDVFIRGFRVGLGGGSVSTNLAIGVGGIAANATGNYNIALGTYALERLTSGAANIAIGGLSLNNSTINNYNTAVGYRSMYSNTEGYQNTGIGKEALGLNTVGYNNTAIGFEANVGANNLNNATVIGAGATVSASNTIQLGNASVINVITSGNILANEMRVARIKGTNEATATNTVLGWYALNTNSTGIENTAVGHRALMSNTTGSSNLAFGANSLVSNTTGTNNTAMGNAILQSNIAGGNNTGVGSGALQSTTNSNNTAIGYASLLNNVGGNNNTAVGVSAMQNNVSGTFNTAVGVDALKGTTGTYNTAIGFNARVLDGSSVTNATAIGNDAYASASHMIRLGNSFVTVIQGQVAFSNSSDIRLKKNISNSKYGLSTVLKLRPVDYTLISNNLKQVGFIAQEVQKLVPEVITGKEGDLEKGETLGITYSSLVPVLAKAIQEQQKQIEEQNNKIASQQKQIDELKALFNKILNQNKSPK
jgi:carbonic anhydrase/acetyltransferase-like protein (isoleucine patch superfamily)